MSLQILAPIKSDNIGELMEWVSFYDKNGKYPANILERFAIGLYQIQSGMQWKDILNKNEAWCAAFIHFLVVAEKLDLHVENEINIDKLYYISPQELLLLISKAQQDVFYKHNSGKTLRSSRYNPKRLTENISKILIALIYGIEKEELKEGFYNATSIMIGKL